MALNVTESHHVNVVCDFLAGTPRPGGRRVTPTEARDALAELAGKSNRTLMAGWSSADVHGRFPNGLAAA